MCQLYCYLLRMRLWLTFFVDFHSCSTENDQMELHFTIFIAIHCILVSLDSTRRSFGVWHDNIQCLALRIRSSLVCIFWVKISKRKMTISHKVQGSRKRSNMFWDYNNIVERDMSACFKRGVLFLLITLDLFVRRTIHANYNKSSYLNNQSFNDEARTCPELAMT